MIEPQGGWEGETIRDGCAWWSRLDDRYLVEIHYVEPQVAYPSARTGLTEVAGLLCIFDGRGDGGLIHVERTHITEGARFGPDVIDVGIWQAMAQHAVDYPESRRLEER